MDKTAIWAEGLSKKYSGSKRYAVRDLALRINPGEVYGFLGPNGAGKTTTIRMLTNFIWPTSGAAYILGSDVAYDSVAAREDVGYMSGELALYPKMTGRDFVAYMSHVQPLKRQKALDELVRRFNANLDTKISKLSRGNRQKIGIIQAFMHEPSVLILDEPTSGLDPLMQEEFYQLVKEAKSRGAAVFVSSHNLAEVQKMCDRVGFIKNGKLVSEQSIERLNYTAANTFDVTFTGPAPISELKMIRNAKIFPHTQSHVTVKLRGDLSAFFRVLARYRVASISQQDINLEEEFLSYYQKAKKR